MTSPLRDLEPVGLDVLAGHIRDGTWVDLRVVEVGTCERVRIKTLNIHRDHDEVVVAQPVVVDERVVLGTHVLDAGAVRECRPTVVSLEDVRPIVPVEPEPPAALPPPPAIDPAVLAPFAEEAHVIAVVVDTICQRTGAQATDVLAGDNTQRKSLYERHEAMWCIFEMTELTPADIATGVFKYLSVMPLTTCRYRIEEALGQSSHAEPGLEALQFAQWCRNTIRKVDKKLGKRYRRSPGGYPLLAP